MIVQYKSRLPHLIQQFNGREIFYPLQDIHEGLTAIKKTVEGLALSNEMAFGAVDGVNKVFTVQNPPSIVMINGVAQGSGDYTYANGQITFKIAPPLGSTVTSFYLGSPGISSTVSTGGTPPVATHTEVLTDGFGNNITASSDLIYVTGVPG